MGLKIKQHKRYFANFITFVACFAIFAMVARLMSWENNYYSTKTREVRATSESVLANVDFYGYFNDNEVPLSQEEYDNYRVEAKSIRYLKIERLDIDTIVEQSETLNSTTLMLQNSLYKATQYSGSALPGENGAIIIGGLAKSNHGDGIFTNLASLEIGDKITLENGAGDIYTYEVQELNIIDTTNVVSRLTNVQALIDNKETLSLIGANVLSDNSDFDTLNIIRATRVD